jgi:hypothetical protein
MWEIITLIPLLAVYRVLSNIWYLVISVTSISDRHYEPSIYFCMCVCVCVCVV